MYFKLLRVIETKDGYAHEFVPVPDQNNLVAGTIVLVLKTRTQHIVEGPQYLLTLDSSAEKT